MLVQDSNQIQTSGKETVLDGGSNYFWEFEFLREFKLIETVRT